ncbi:putative toxin-antitoxin system toxin component, PIN family [Candidatus Nanohalobium constans]|uniref:Putative toxin-antitoxin system toxin component,PIN family n=1 Tax=Candidatus Nanohalobium constans TaxID=2565781 RepID=A0A5Q0UHB1_9ARCH|nr:putative toxin-antitoxin system toxin component, PIN family [Candidatus Nanohalobium constans]QGA81062.1 putative toxin-antitoxin system toxin component,PIN family [Candidatus Nanohalobium constans]
MGEKVVLDTNVLISAIGWDAKPEECLELALGEEIDAFATQSMIDEVSEVLEYDKFDFSEKEQQKFLEILVSEFLFISSEESIDKSQDPEDNKFLECAVSANADYIISGDSDLLELKEYENITIVKPQKFLELRGQE